jgi:putative NADH-flavin reductase
LQLRGEIEDFTRFGDISELVVNSAVKRGIALTEITRDLQLVQTITQLGPNALVNLDLQKLARKILRDGDMSPEVLKSESEVQETLEQQSQQEQAQQLQALAQQLQQQNQPPSV